MWILLLALTALGPFALPLVWRTPSLDRTGKWIMSLVVIAVTGYVAWELVTVVRDVGSLLSAAGQ